MRSFLKVAILTLVLAFGASVAAHAVPCASVEPNCKPIPKPAPEVDPSLAVAGISFLAGTLTVLRARRRK